MTGAQALAARGALGLVMAGASVVAVSVQRWQRAAAGSFDRGVMLAFLGSRLGLYALVFFVAHIPARGDVVGFYVPEALQALAGKLPYREILTSYAPLHPYLDAAVMAVWRSPLAIILLAIVAEAVLLPVWLRMGRVVFSEPRVRTAALLYLCSPISLQFVAIDGQDNVVIAVLLALATWLFYRGRTVLSGMLVALGVVVVKFLPLLYFPVFFLAATGRRMRWVLGALGVLAVGYGPLLLMRLPVLYPLQFEGQERTASNLPFLVQGVLGVPVPGRVADAVLLLALAGLLGLMTRAMWRAPVTVRLRGLVFGPAALTLALLLLSKKSWPPYLMLVLFPLCLLFGEEAGRRWRVAAFALFGVVATVAHSVWATIFQQFLAPAFHQNLQHPTTGLVIFLGLQIGLVVGYGLLLRACVVQIFPGTARSESTR